MAAISLPCPKCAVSPRILKSGPSLVAGSVGFLPNLVSDGRRLPVLKARLKEISIENSPNSSSKKVENEEISSSKDSLKEESKKEPVSDAAISAFMDEATRLILLVDTSDVSELKLKHNDFELEIRKKEALTQPSPQQPPMPAMQYPPYPFAMSAPPPPPAAAAPADAPATPPAAQAAAPPPAALPAPAKSNAPALKSPMAGTFYRAPSPTASPFVKIGDKVKKGQVVCIIEAMKLMNEIESDKDGTVVDICIENGSPVGLGAEIIVLREA